MEGRLGRIWKNQGAKEEFSKIDFRQLRAKILSRAIPEHSEEIEQEEGETVGGVARTSVRLS